MAVQVRETIVTPQANGCVVQLHISDAMLGDESAEIVLRLTVRMRPESDQLSQYHRQAMREAMQALRSLME